METHFAPDDTAGKDEEQKHIMDILHVNGYSGDFVNRVVRQRARTGRSFQNKSVDQRWISVPYVQGMSEAVAKVLEPLGIKVAHQTRSWKWWTCSGLKDKIAPEKRKGVVYCVTCKECDSVYVGETLRNLMVRMPEHKRHARGGEVQRSAVAEHAAVEDHQIDWEDAKVLDTAQAWDRRKYKEALHIHQQGKEHPMMNKDAGWKIHGVWNEFL